MESPSMLAPTANVVRPPPSLPFVHRYYLLLKAHYFLFFSAFGMVYPIINIVLRSHGLSNVELSYINIIVPFLVFITNPLLGLIADHSRRYLLTFNIVLVLSMILFTIMFILPPIKTHHIQADVIYDQKLGHFLDFCASQEVATQCSSRSQCGCSYQAICTSTDSLNQKKYSNFTFSMNANHIKNIESTMGVGEPSTCGIQYRVPFNEGIEDYRKNTNRTAPFYYTHDSDRVAVCEITCSIAHYCHGSRYSDQLSFILLYSLVFILATNALSNAVPLGASIGFSTLSKPDLFGRQRFWGTVGFGISAFSAGLIYGIFQTEYVYIILFCIATIACILVTSFIRIAPIRKKSIHVNEEKDVDEISGEKKTKKKSPFQLSDLIPLLKQIDVLVFLSLTLIWGISYAGLDPYLFLYVDEIAVCQSRFIIGSMSLVSAVSEVAGLFLSGYILKKLGTNVSAIIILLAFTIRFGGYYLIRNPFFMASMETMHFFNFGLLYVLIVRKADDIAPPGLAGTLQGAALGISLGLGRGVGLLIASAIYTSIEPRSLFLIFSLFNLTAAVIYSVYFIIYRQLSEKPIENNNDHITVEYDAKSKEEPLLMIPNKNQTNE